MKGVYTLLILAMLGALSFPLGAATYYVDQGAAGASDSNAGTATAPWLTLSKANQTLVAGDTVFIKKGTYTSYVAPLSSGRAGSPITYRNYSNDVVSIQNTSRGILLDGKSYIVVQGINCTNLDQMLYIQNSANHNEIGYCNFVHMRTQTWFGSRIYSLSASNWVHHCVFGDWGGCYSGWAYGTPFEIGDDDGDATYPGNYNLVENCVFYNGGHHTIGVHGHHNVIRNNYMYNMVWTAGKGERTLYMNGYGAYCCTNLIDNNKIAYSYVPCDQTGVDGAQISSPYNIFRRNGFYYNNRAALQFSTTDNYHPPGPCNNYVYNNSFMGNGWQLDGGSDDPTRTQIGFFNYSTLYSVKANVVKNNVFYDSPRTYAYNGPTSASDQVFANNYDGDASGDPKFVNAKYVSIALGNAPYIPANPADATYPNLALQSNSPAVGKGGALTTITSASGSGTSFVVSDPNYFMDGWGVVQGDEIQLLGSTQTAHITRINYATKTITVDTSLSWTQNQGLCLTYSGTSPDAGAYGAGATTPPATNQPPVVNVASAVTVGYPTSSATLQATASDPNHLPLSVTWSQLDGPAPASFSATNATNTVVSVQVPGAYWLRITVSDGLASASADTTVTFGMDPSAVSLQATSGTIASPFVSQSGYISQSTSTTSTNGGRAAYSFNVVQAGNFVIVGTVNAPDEGANSLYANIDAEPVDPTMTWDIPVTSGFEARAVSWRGNGDPSNSQYVPKVFALSAGAHTLIVRGREPGVQLSQLQIAKIVSGATPAPPNNLHVLSAF